MPDAPCPHHPHTPVTDGACGGCTPYPRNCKADIEAGHAEPVDAWAARIGLRPAQLDAITGNTTTTAAEPAAAESPTPDAEGLYWRLRRAVEAARREVDEITLVAIAAALAAEPSRLEQENERLRAEIDTADRIRTDAQRDRDQHAALLREVLALFPHSPFPDQLVHSDFVTVEFVNMWRSHLAQTVETAWWEQLAQVRAERDEARQHTQALTDEVAALRTVLEQGRTIQADTLRSLSTAWARRRRYRLAWRSARRRATKHRTERNQLQHALDEVRRFNQMTVDLSCRAEAIVQARDTLHVIDTALATQDEHPVPATP